MLYWLHKSICLCFQMNGLTTLQRKINSTYKNLMRHKISEIVGFIRQNKIQVK